jgi:[acyl-carrier-protein] S-malonyltransferase
MTVVGCSFSGEKAAVDRAVELAGEAGAKCIPLKVSGPFHTSLMAPAAEKLHAYFENTEFGEMKVPMVFGTTGKPLADGETVAGLLEQQVMSSIHFEDIVRYMKDAGIERVVEIGPNATLAKLVRKTCKELEVTSVFDVASYEKTLAKLQG